jgi:hypothetical protein
MLADFMMQLKAKSKYGGLAQASVLADVGLDTKLMVSDLAPLY